MAKPMPKNTTQNTNPANEGKAPVAPPVDTYSGMMDALANAGTARGAAIDAVCAYLSNGSFTGADASTLDAINGAVKVAKLAKIAKIVGALLNVTKIGAVVNVPTLSPVDYK